LLGRALFRESALTAISIAGVLLFLIIFAGLTEALAQAALGKQTGELALKVFSLEIVRTTDTLLPLALFLGVLLTMSRWYRDSEITALEACGISLFRLWLSLMALAGVFAVIVSYLSFYLSPLAAGQVDVIKSGASSSGAAMVGIRAGIFYHGLNSAIYYVESLDKDEKSQDKHFSGVFARAGLVPGEKDAAGGKSGIVAAKTGRRSIDEDGTKMLVLENGHYYEAVPGQKTMRVFSFDEYSASLSEAPTSISGGIDAVPMSVLYKQKTLAASAEWHWRLARPIALFLLVSLAMVLAYTNPRQSRFGSMFLALLVFFLYSNLLGLFAGMIGSGKLPSYIGLWPVHGVFSVFAFYAFLRRQKHLPLFDLSLFSVAHVFAHK